jgi:hypothetical protein
MPALRLVSGFNYMVKKNDQQRLPCQECGRRASAERNNSDKLQYHIQADASYCLTFSNT